MSYRVIERVRDRLVTSVVNIGFDVAMRINRRRYWPAFEQAATDPASTQATTLVRILRQNATTSFGREHGFGTIRTAEEFRHAVPVHDYETLRTLIEEQERTGSPTLTAERPVLYAQTSGTSGSPKFLPITASGIERGARTQRLFATSVHTGTGMFSGRIVGIGSPAKEGILPGGTPFGSASGMVYEGMPSVVRGKYVLAPDVLAIADHDERYEVIAAHCLAERNVTGVATANPSTLLRLRAVMIDRWDDLVETVATSKPERAAELRSLRARHGHDIGYQHLWPNLAAITTWTGGSAGFAIAALRRHLNPRTKIVELGYSASELRGTIGIDPETNLCAPLLADNYYEFVERSVREEATAELSPDIFVGVEALQPGLQYYLYVTTFDGLYRYDMNDIVEVTGRFMATPTLAFVQKGRGVTNITGEKLSENQVIEAIHFVQQRLGVALAFFMLLADEKNSHYRLYTEDPADSGLGSSFASAVDDRLAATNVEYRSKRASGRLGSIVGRELRVGTADAYRAACVADGQRDTQFKYLHVQYFDACPFDFEAHGPVDTEELEEA